MKKLLTLLLVFALVGCTTRTEYGECVGINEQDRHADLVYRASAWNIFLGVLFVETIVVPVMVALDSTYCPVGKKQ